MVDLSFNLRKLKKESGITLKELAERIGMKQNTVSNWFTGKRQPRIELLPQIAKVYGITVDELLKEADEIQEYTQKCDTDICGQRFGRLVAIRRSSGVKSKVKWFCKCDCGNETEVLITSLMCGNTRSCGCLRQGTKQGHKIRHEGRLYKIWKAMRTRITNPNTSCFEYYGGRGIEICDEWTESYEAFHDWAIDNGYSDALQIDRINVDKGYSPNNCRWVNAFVQMNNTRRNHYIEYNGEIRTVSEWARELGINRTTLNYRINNGVPPDIAIEKGLQSIGK
ncbi:MAG: helix-turn-helix domain-containing protein [Clostridiales bacterium]|nr:helix-turn-helix domain-containing protein [Clostridiales bacterium]